MEQPAKGNSPRRKGGVDSTHTDIQQYAADIYCARVKMATENLVNFLAETYPQSNQLCVTYFDEVDTIDLLFWILLRVLSNQNEGVVMWYVFMATKSGVQDFSPRLKQCECQPVFLFKCLIVL
jgi:hypothetical protein